MGLGGATVAQALHKAAAAKPRSKVLHRRRFSGFFKG